jgi:hypothetical protein
MNITRRRNDGSPAPAEICPQGKSLKPLMKNRILAMAQAARNRPGARRAAARAFLWSKLAHKLNSDTGGGP